MFIQAYLVMISQWSIQVDAAIITVEGVAGVAIDCKDQRQLIFFLILEQNNNEREPFLIVQCETCVPRRKWVGPAKMKCKGSS